MADVGIQMSGASELADYLTQIGASQTSVDDALIEHGRLVVTEAARLAPRKTGVLASAISSTFTAGAGGLTVSAGADRVPYAYTFHAQAMGKTNGYMVYRVRGHTRKGASVTPYKARRPVKNLPYLFTAWRQNEQKLRDTVQDALAKIVNGG